MRKPPELVLETTTYKVMLEQHMGLPQLYVYGKRKDPFGVDYYEYIGHYLTDQGPSLSKFHDELFCEYEMVKKGPT